MRCFLTGDKHGNFQSPDDYQKIREFCFRFGTTKEDAMIVLGDHGIHYDEGEHDESCRRMLGRFPITFIMIRGNHDMRPKPEWKSEYIENDLFSGNFWRDPDYDNILYTEEFGWYKFNGKDVYIIGGAYSADKFYRLEMQRIGRTGFRWFEDEQLTNAERSTAEEQLFSRTEGPFYIMSHTCPIRYEPREMFINGVDQNTVDRTMEIWMDDLLAEIWRRNLRLEAWYCGHWHTDKQDDIMTFMYHDIHEV